MRAEVAAGAERTTRTRDNEYLDVRVGIGIPRQGSELRVHRGIDGVQLLGTVERGDRDAGLTLLDENRLISVLREHGSSPLF